MSTVIKVENLSKQYRLGNVGTGSLAHDLNRTWHRLRGKQDPYLKIGEENDRTQKGSSEYVWALKDINFELKQGEVLGIIGRNGAGKSTLLKILSRTTTPTTGSVKIKGRVASLLEVGTGFHPELSGRENIFLNGAILGMTKQEIKSKFDEIVDFAGVERYIDTPVKRYSSGMYVRLAFGVAAHLEPEILIVDEVLAVGDVEFQKKALGKMKDVSDKEGRTVLFVSHNMGAIGTLCQRAVLLQNGRVSLIGDVDECLYKYLNDNTFNGEIVSKVNEYRLDNYSTLKIFSLDKDEYFANEVAHLKLSLYSNEANPISGLTLLIYNESDTRVGIIDLREMNVLDYSMNKTEINLGLKIKGFQLIEGLYKIGIYINSRLNDGNYLNILAFKIKPKESDYVKYPLAVQGFVSILFEAKFIERNELL